MQINCGSPDRAPPNKNLLLPILIIFTEATNDPVLLGKNGKVLFEEKTNNQDIFVKVLMLICAWQTSILLWLSSLIARKLIFLCLLLISFKR